MFYKTCKDFVRCGLFCHYYISQCIWSVCVFYHTLHWVAVLTEVVWFFQRRVYQWIFKRKFVNYGECDPEGFGYLPWRILVDWLHPLGFFLHNRTWKVNVLFKFPNTRRRKVLHDLECTSITWGYIWYFGPWRLELKNYQDKIYMKKTGEKNNCSNCFRICLDTGVFTQHIFWSVISSDHQWYSHFVMWYVYYIYLIELSLKMAANVLWILLHIRVSS